MKDLKTVVRRNLPINDIYKIVDSYYLGKMLDGCGTVCDNCNKLITNVAVIENKGGVKFNVGLDCAETLQGLNKFEFSTTIADFNEAKAIRAKVNKALKEGKEIEFSVNCYGKFNMYCERKFSETKEIDFAKRMFPDYFSKIVNPEKIGFVYNALDLNFDNCFIGIIRSHLGETKEISVNGYDIKVESIAKTHVIESTGEQITNYILNYKVEIKGVEIVNGNTYMKRDLNGYINNGIAKYEFSIYSNEVLA